MKLRVTKEQAEFLKELLAQALEEGNEVLRDHEEKERMAVDADEFLSLIETQKEKLRAYHAVMAQIVHVTGKAWEV